MSVYKVVEIVGTSDASLSDAIQGAIQRAGTTLEDCRWFEVKEIRGKIEKNDVAEFQVKLDVGFLLHAPQAKTANKVGAKKSKTEPVAAKRGAVRVPSKRFKQR